MTVLTNVLNFLCAITDIVFRKTTFWPQLESVADFGLFIRKHKKRRKQTLICYLCDRELCTTIRDCNSIYKCKDVYKRQGSQCAQGAVGAKSGLVRGWRMFFEQLRRTFWSDGRIIYELFYSQCYITKSHAPTGTYRVRMRVTTYWKPVGAD